MRGSDEGFFRTHAADAPDLPSLLLHLVERYDLVLVEGYKRAAIEKVWVLKEGETSAPADVPQVIATLPPGDGRHEKFASLLDDWLREQWLKTPVCAAVLIGGGSRRMGKPKHLMLLDGKTWGERTVDLLREISQEVVIVGDGDVPGSLGECPRLPDAPDAEGPMAGILAAMRWAPLTSWLVSACDLPHLSTDALRWILSARSPGVWATLPRRKGADVIEPLLGHYDFRARSLLEGLTRASRYRLNELASEEKVSSPTPPEHLEQSWFNVNTPDDLKR